jgi:hypothetical protein
VSILFAHFAKREALFPISLARSALLRAGLRRKEGTFQPPLRHDFFTQTREKRASLGPVRSPRFAALISR